MSDAQVKAKPVWTRCPRCGWRVFNDAIDRSKHDQNCPADLKKEVEALSRELTKVNKLLTRIGDQIEAEPDLDDVAEWEQPDPVDEVGADSVEVTAEPVEQAGYASYGYDSIDDTSGSTGSVSPIR